MLNWFRGILQTDGGLNASKMSLQWCSNVLRMVTPHMWVCRALIQQVDRAALEAVAQVTETNDAFKIALREGQGLDDLELALLPVLPVESVRYTSVDSRPLKLSRSTITVARYRSGKNDHRFV